MTAPHEGSWVGVPADSDFPLENLPFGVFERHGVRHIGVAIGASIFDLHDAAGAGLFDDILARTVLEASTLNPLLSAGRKVWSELRARLMETLRSTTVLLDRVDRDKLLAPQHGAKMHVPMHVGDYADFYSSLEHATNLGKIFRPDGEPLLPNWRWVPIGYHGRSSTIVVDGTPVRRPAGQRKLPGAAQPVFGPSQMLDIELEIGFVTGPANAMGTRIPVQRARDHIFGVVLLNDWSARDIQAWEYQPLGPFLGKSFATSVSPWIVTLDALEPYRLQGPRQEPQPLEYLRSAEPWNYDIGLDVELQAPGMSGPHRISHTNFKHMYWNMAQQLAHLTVNGTSAQPGDLYGSGTISGPQADSLGSLIELSWRGARPIALPGGLSRSFLQDGDTIILSGAAAAAGKPRIGLGRVSGTILPCE
ncbi:MAG: fumarylacetoacetase [Candidatus Baltobacteraceae bacterium]